MESPRPALPAARSRSIVHGLAFWSALTAPLLLGACSLAPAYHAPALPVAAAWPADAQSMQKPADAIPVADTGWRDYFSDSRLQALITQALTNNRDLRSAILHVEEARAAYGIQRADQFPTLGLGAGETRGRTPGDLNLTGQPLVGTEYRAGVNLSAWELDFWGRVRSLKDAALENFLATDAARRAVTLSLVAQVADSYLALLELDERIGLTQRTIASREETFRIFTRRFEVGSISRLELTQAETLLSQAQTLGAQLEQARAAQLHALTVLVGSAPAPLPADARLNDAMLRDLQAGLPSDLLTRRPDIVAAEHRLKASHANIGAARAAFFPRIALTGSLGTASAELSGLFEPGSKAWSFSPVLSLPIFDAGRNRAGLDLAEVRRDLAVAGYEKTVQTAFREVSDALSARHWLAEQVRIQQTTLAAQTERARLAKLRYDNGAAPYLEVLDAQRDLLAVEQQLVQTRRALLSSRVNLYAALGGGSQTDVSAPSR